MITPLIKEAENNKCVMNCQQLNMTTKTGILYIVATPIGNLKDISQRALETLQAVDLILAEDTRHSKKLLNHYQIDNKLSSYHNYNEQQKSQQLIDMLEQGLSLALISDAGTPLISDPGYFITKTAHQHHIRIVPIPGCSAFITALSASGLPTDKFSFEGFLPAKEGNRLAKLEPLKQLLLRI